MSCKAKYRALGALCVFLAVALVAGGMRLITETWEEFWFLMALGWGTIGFTVLVIALLAGAMHYLGEARDCPEEKPPDVKVKAADIMRDVTLRVELTGVSRAMFRIRVALWLLWAVYKVAGFGDFEIACEKEGEDE